MIRDPTHTMKQHIDTVISIDFSHDGTRLYSSSDGRRLGIWSMEGGKYPGWLRRHPSICILPFSIQKV
jgi:WD40 repeat protein